MIYACSDIHGCYNRFIKLLNRINFTEKDELYILGDTIDRNPDGIKVLLYIMENQNNIHLIMGNHEDFMYRYLFRQDMNKRIYNEIIENYNDIWFADCNGGRITYDAYNELDEDTKQAIFKFLSELPIAILKEVNDIKYHLSHSGTIPRITEKDYWTMNDVNKYEKETIVWDSMYRWDGMLHYTNYPEGYISLLGHVPVQRVRDSYNRYAVYKKDRTIDIDGGCAYYALEEEGVKTALSCYCLDTQKVVYIR